LINTALTVKEGNANSHNKNWELFMNILLKELLIKLSKNCTTQVDNALSEFNNYMINETCPKKDSRCTILCFGKYAIDLVNKLLKTTVSGVKLNKLINMTVSSHPSGLSCNGKIKKGSIIQWPFVSADHFGFLKKKYGIEFDKAKYKSGLVNSLFDKNNELTEGGNITSNISDESKEIIMSKIVVRFPDSGDK
jgi:uracil DNA glycosylase